MHKMENTLEYYSYEMFIQQKWSNSSPIENHFRKTNKFFRMYEFLQSFASLHFT